MGRLEDLEKKNVKDSQTEILMFVGTGLFILMSFELFGHK
jgi:prefoldin subunit 5